MAKLLLGTKTQYPDADGLHSMSYPTSTFNPSFGRPSTKYSFSDGNLYYDFPNQKYASEQILRYHSDGVGQNISNWVNFDRWYSPDVDKDENSGRHYVFFCRPDLFLVEASGSSYNLSTESRVGQDPFFQYLGNYHPEIISSLCAEFGNNSALATTKTKQKAVSGSGLGNSTEEDGTTDRNGRSLTIHSLIPYLTGRVESLQLPDYTIKENSLVQPFTKYTMPYPSSAIESQTGGNFDVTFRDDGNYSIRKLFYAWIYYMDGVMRNKFKPKDKYIRYNALDYATSVYDIQVDATGERIVWWSKYTGVFPLTSPISDLSFNRGSSPNTTVQIPFAYFHYETLNPAILVDLNYNSLGYIYMRNGSNDAQLNPYVKTANIYDGNNSSVFLGNNSVGRPVVYMDMKNRIAKLKWLMPPNN